MSRPLTTHELHGRYIPVYTKRDASTIDLVLPSERAAIRAAGRERLAVYVAKTLFTAVVRVDVHDTPDELRILFQPDEWPAQAREAYRLTPELYETIAEKTWASMNDSRLDIETRQLAESRVEALRDLGRRHGAILAGQ